MKYQIYYSADGLNKGEFPLSAKMIEHNFSCLPTDIEMRLLPKGIESKVIFVGSGDNKYADVYLDDKGKKLNLQAIFADCLRSINVATSGLCFLARPDNSVKN